MKRNDIESTAVHDLSQSEYDQLGIELAASLRLYLELLALDAFSPEVTSVMSDLAIEIVTSTPQQVQSLQ
ncbi:MAG: hypothetical protein KZQ93_13090 [Candidatus Thiodiazotropha sp. (ex Monitilora ramsayi)]|nr:hypothetical protein [Candidatus Thiodiazotropha sp. (ex Monitilora ramsayi)]